MSVPEKYFPRCPKCGEVMTTNLRADDKFVEDAGRHVAAYRYKKFLSTYAAGEIVYLELGVGGNTPGIIKYPFWRLTAENPRAIYVCINRGQAFVPDEIAEQSLIVDADIAEFLNACLMNEVCPPMTLDENFLKLQDELLSAEVSERGVVKISDIPNIKPHIKIWRSDITRLEVEAIVNAANEKLLGCFIPLHGCIDNAIHSAAVLQLREACNKIMEVQGHDEPIGSAKITPAFNHESCLKLAAEIAIATVKKFLAAHELEIIFNVFKEIDEKIYRSCLNGD